jgi:MFS family permease
MASPQSQRLKVLGAGVISLVLMLGVARFSYTPLLPLMQQQAGLGVAEGGWLAAINYMGYLSRAVIASLISDIVLKDRLYRLGLAATPGGALDDKGWRTDDRQAVESDLCAPVHGGLLLCRRGICGECDLYRRHRRAAAESAG